MHSFMVSILINPCSIEILPSLTGLGRLLNGSPSAKALGYCRERRSRGCAVHAPWSIAQRFNAGIQNAKQD